MPKGQVQRFTRIKEDFLEAFYHEQVGGVEGLVAWVSMPGNRGKFYEMIVRLLPKELSLSGEGGGPIQLSDPERVTKLQYVISALERLAKERLTAKIEPEPLLIEAEVTEEVPTENLPPKDRISNLVRFVGRIENAKRVM